MDSHHEKQDTKAENAYFQFYVDGEHLRLAPESMSHHGVKNGRFDINLAEKFAYENLTSSQKDKNFVEQFQHKWEEALHHRDKHIRRVRELYSPSDQLALDRFFRVTINRVVRYVDWNRRPGDKGSKERGRVFGDFALLLNWWENFCSGKLKLEGEGEDEKGEWYFMLDGFG
ncbi:hypothetical protein BJX99DRAFT_257678 [Aspergillus californicus]